MRDFKVRPLHRQRTGRRPRVEVLNENELADLLKVPIGEVRSELDRRGWSYHVDSADRLWASLPDGFRASHD